MDAKTILGWNVRRLRVAKGLSQERLALAAGMDRAYVGRIERGSENVTLARLEDLARVLDVPIAELFEATGASERPAGLRSGRRRKAAPRLA